MAAPIYDLAVQGIRDFARYGSALSQQPISRDPLSGVVDGINTVFHTNYFPILASGSLVVRVQNSVVSGVADYDTGEVTLNTPPLFQPVANYTTTPYTGTQMLQFLMSGFDEMELRYSRGWKLVDGLGDPAIETSAQLYISDRDGAEPVILDPLTFGLSRTQISFYQLCAEYRYYLAIYGLKAQTAYMWRETVRGMTVDQSKMPANLKGLIETLEKRLADAQSMAEAGYYDGTNYGAYVSAPATLQYLGGMEWQTDSKNADYRSLVPGYHYPLRAFG